MNEAERDLGVIWTKLCVDFNAYSAKRFYAEMMGWLHKYSPPNMVFKNDHVFVNGKRFVPEDSIPRVTREQIGIVLLKWMVSTSSLPQGEGFMPTRLIGYQSKFIDDLLALLNPKKVCPTCKRPEEERG